MGIGCGELKAFYECEICGDSELVNAWLNGQQELHANVEIDGVYVTNEEFIGHVVNACKKCRDTIGKSLEERYQELLRKLKDQDND